MAKTKKPTMKGTAKAIKAMDRAASKKVKPEQLDLPTVEVKATPLVTNQQKAAKFASQAPPAEKVEAVTAAEAKRHQTAKAGLPPAAYDNVPRIVHNPKERTAYYVQKDVRFEVDPFSLEHTIGAGPYGGDAKKGVIDMVPPKVLKQLAAANGWPCEPFDWPALRPLVSGLVEIAWRTDMTGEPPRRCVENQEMRVAHYKAGLQSLACVASKPARAEKKPGVKRELPAGFGPRAATRWRYTPTKALLKAEFGGQQLEILKWFVANPKGGEVKAIADGMRAAGFKEGKQPAEKVVAFYMNDWLKKQYVTRVEAASEATA